MAWWFFKRLEQCVKRVFRQHVHFVDDVDFVACRHSGVAHSLNNLAHIVDARVACGIHFDDVDMPTFGDGNAWLARATGVNGWPALPVNSDAVERFGNQTRGRSLAHPAHTSHQKRMRQSVTFNGIAECLHHGILPD